MAFRQLLKYKFHTIVSALCMAVGLTINGYLGTVVKFQFGGMNHIELFKKNKNEGYRRGTNGITGSEYRQIAERKIEGLQGLHAQGGNTEYLWAYCDNVEELYEVSAEGVSPDFFRHYYDPRGSLLVEGNDSIADNEIIITEQLARKMFDTESPIGKSLTLLKDTVEKSREVFYANKSFRIAGVCKIIAPGAGNECYIYAPIADKDRCAFIRACPKSGYSTSDIQRSIDGTVWMGADDGAPFEIEASDYNKSDPGFWLIMLALGAFSLLIFITGLINFMKFMIQMFYSRQRELALRKCLGSNNRGLYMLLACEVFIMLTASFLLSCIITELSLLYLDYMNLDFVEAIPLDAVLATQLQTSVIAFAIALMVIFLPILRLRRASMRGSLMRRRQGTAVRNFMVGLQFLVAIICFGFLGVTLKLEFAERGRHEDRMSADELDRIFILDKWEKNWEDIRPLLEKLPVVENFTAVEYETERRLSFNYQRIYVNGDSIYAYIIAYGGTPNYFEFFNIPMDGKIVPADADNYVYIDKKLHRTLIERGNYDGTLELSGGRKVSVAGVADHEFTFDGQFVFADYAGKVPFSGSMLFVNNSNLQKFYYRIKDGVSMEEARNAFKEVYYKFQPRTFDVIVPTLKEAMDELSAANRMFKHMAYIMAFISLLVVVLSIYSTISLDATTKQKEIAIRKINGARKGDILRRFVAPYVVTFTVTFLASYPLMASFYWKNAGLYSSAMSVEFIVIYGVGLFFGILALLAIITWYRIRMIMSVNPAEVIRRE